MTGVGEKIMVSAFTGVMGPVLRKLTQLMEKEYAKIKGVKKKVESLKRELITINVALETYEMMDSPGKQVKAWMKEVRAMAYNIEDCIDLFMYHVAHEPSDNTTGIKKLIRKSIRKLKKLEYRHKFAEQIQELKSLVDEAYERHIRYKIDDSDSSVMHTEIDPRLPALYVEVEKLVGIEGPSQEIIGRLIGEESGPKKQHMVVSIVGSGGSGKTTLANQVYQKIRDRFSSSSFISVSQKPNMINILSDLLWEIGDRDNRSDNVRHVIERLRAHLENERYLIVIDDIWSTSAWESIQCALPKNSRSSRIITTTRNRTVAEYCCASHEDFVYPMKPLSRIDSTHLFLTRTFRVADQCLDHLFRIMIEILCKCDGLPLAIVHIASLLASKQGKKEEWERVRDSIGYVHGKDKELEVIDNILALSYSDLPHHLKTCLLYLSMFPEDSRIAKNILIWRWIAEGFVIPKHGYTLEEVGESYFHELVNRSMIKPGPISYDGKATVCQVHDIVLDFIVSRSTEENFISILDTPTQGEKVRRLSLWKKIRHAWQMSQKTMDFSHLRSFDLAGGVTCMPPVLDLPLLRVLCLDDSYVLKDDHLENIGSLVHLKYLGLRNTHIKNLPVQLGRLEFLQTLNLRGSTIRELPEGVVRLKRLRHLVGDSLILPDGFGSMEALQELWSIGGCKSSINFGANLQNLIQLRVLRLSDTFWDVDADHQKIRREGLLSALCKLGENNLLRSLYFFLPDDGHECFADSNCLPTSLQDFRLENSAFPRFPKWINASLCDLTYLYFSVDRMQATELCMLERLPALSVLHLAVREIPSEGFVVHHNGFQRLTYLRFGNALGPGLIFQGAMPKLQELQLEFHADAAHASYGDVVFGIQHLFSLNSIYVYINHNRHTRAVNYAKRIIMYEVKLLPSNPKFHITLLPW